jgi:putative membrane-bound dehydrogenase-like protein
VVEGNCYFVLEVKTDNDVTINYSKIASDNAGLLKFNESLKPTMRNRFLAIITFLIFSLSCDFLIKPPSGFQMEEGFQLRLVASEPLIYDPVDMEFNEQGEALVLEMPGYPLEDQASRIILLRDQDTDGQYDERIVFAENLQMATSLMPYKKGVLVAAPPYLLFVKDTDGDYRADAVDTLMGGFSTGNLQHNYNGLTYGLDNWIYAANGGNSGKPYWWDDTTSAMNLRGQDFRFHLESKKMERIGESSGGFGLGMDEYGRLFETHNLTHISHLVFPDRYFKNSRLLVEHSLLNISDHEENGLSRIYPVGEQETRVNHPEQSGYFSGACGILFYGDNAYGKDYQRTVWVADVVLNLIHADKLHPQGSAFTASRIREKKEFLACEDRSFRPVNMTVGPDGSVYVIDMYRAVIEHPEWIPDEIEQGLNLNAGKEKGRIYKIIPGDKKVPEFNTHQWKTADDYIARLNHPNQWVRKTAHRLLMESELTTGQLKKIAQWLQSESAYARLHALWILEGKGALTSEWLMGALKDADDGVKENALLMAEQRMTVDEGIFQRVLELLTDPAQRVRMQAALSVSTLPDELFQIHRDKIIDHLIASSEWPLDDWNIAAITLAAHSAAPDLLTRLMQRRQTDILLIKSLAKASGQSTGSIRLVLNSLRSGLADAPTRLAIIEQLAAGIYTSVNGAPLLADLLPLEKNADINLISATARLRKKLSLPPAPAFVSFSLRAIKKAGNRSLPDSVRLQQLSLLSLLPYRDKAEVLFQCLNSSEPMQIQEEALRQLAGFPEPEIGQRLVKQWAGWGPLVRRYASDLLIYRDVHHDALLSGLEQGIINIGEMNFDLERRRELLLWTENEETRRRAAALFSDAGVTTRKQAIEKMKDALLLKGSAREGEAVFTTLCSSCHRYGAIGKEVGPVLTEINRKSKESLLHDILDPNAAVETRYINHKLVTVAGEIHVGMVENETDYAITIKKAGGEAVVVEKKNIKSFYSLGASLMMEGIESNMTLQEMADLLEFLQKGDGGG